MPEQTSTIITIGKDGNVKFEGFIGEPNQVQIIIPLQTNKAMQWGMSFIGKNIIQLFANHFFKKD